MTSGEDLSRRRVAEGSYPPHLPDVSDVPEVASLPELPRTPGTVREDGRARLAQHRRELREDWRERHLGPQGEARSRDIVGEVRLIPIEKIVSDTDFRNEMRLPATEDESRSLEDSMRSEGLKHPIVVVEHGGEYHVRWGFRRAKAALKLGWSSIPAIVLPADTPLPSQYWSNIVENLARSKGSTYELALAVQTMRDKFRVDYREFARRTGYDCKYIDNLLRTIDNLPPELLEKWRERRPIPVGYYVTWAAMRPEEAVRAFDTYVGLHPRAAKPASTVSDGPEIPRIPGPKKKRGDFPVLMASKAGLQRMTRLRDSIEYHRPIDAATRDAWLQIVDFCLGKRNDVPGVHDEARRQKTHRVGKRSRVRQTDVANFHLASAGDPVDVSEARLAELSRSVETLDEQSAKLLDLITKTGNPSDLERSVRSLNREQATKLLEMLRQNR